MTRQAIRLIPAGVATILVGFLALPVAWLLASAVLGGSLLDAAGSRVVLAALALSLTTTAIAVSVVVVAGTPLAYLLARGRVPGRRLVETIVDLPIVLPPSVAGLSLLLLFGRQGPLGAVLDRIGLELAFSSVAVVMAQVFVAAPFYVRTARAGFATVDRSLEDAARADGAREAAVFQHVTLPLAAPALSAGIVLAWARALGEFGATIMFAGNVVGRTQTLPLAVYSEFQSSLAGSISAAAILVAAAFLVLFVARLTRRPLEY